MLYPIQKNTDPPSKRYTKYPFSEMKDVKDSFFIPDYDRDLASKVRAAFDMWVYRNDKKGYKCSFTKHKQTDSKLPHFGNTGLLVLRTA